MCFSVFQCCKKSQKVANKSNKVLHKECFTNVCPNTSFFYWLIMIWICLIVLSILVYGILLVEVLTLNDPETSEMIMNIVIHIVNGLFTFAAVFNLPVRCRRLFKLYIRKSEIKSRRRVTLTLFATRESKIRTMSTEMWDQESALIFDRLSWCTQHTILQALLWNSIFQIINQVFRCVYYSYELADTYPGNIFVNAFFPLAILTSVVASMIQAVAENRFREKHSLGKKPNNCWKTMVEFWHNLWKVQTEGKMALAQQFDTSLTLSLHNKLVDLRARTVNDEESAEEDPDVIYWTKTSLNDPVKVNDSTAAQDELSVINLTSTYEEDGSGEYDNTAYSPEQHVKPTKIRAEGFQNE